VQTFRAQVGEGAFTKELHRVYSLHSRLCTKVFFFNCFKQFQSIFKYFQLFDLSKIRVSNYFKNPVLSITGCIGLLVKFSVFRGRISFSPKKRNRL